MPLKQVNTRPNGRHPATLLWLQYWGEWPNTVSNCPKIPPWFYPFAMFNHYCGEFFTREQGDAAFDFLFDQKKTTRIPPQKNSTIFGAYKTPFSCFGATSYVDFQSQFFFPTAVVLPPPPRPWRPWPFVSRILKNSFTAIGRRSFFTKSLIFGPIGLGKCRQKYCRTPDGLGA